MAKRKKEAEASEQAEAKEHKKNWREVYATVEDIKDFLSGQLLLRYNMITRRVECHLLNRSPWDSYDGSPESAMQLMMEMAEDQTPSGSPCSGGENPILWRPINDRIVNSLWAELSKQKQVRIQDIYHVLESDFVTEYHPFRYYLEHLPPWDGKSDDILAMSISVQVKGGVDEQYRFANYLKKWLVAMVAGWVDDTVVNNVILVLIGEQGSYKTTWFNYLLPPELKQYFYTKTNANRMGRDDLLTLAQYGLVCCEELDTMRPAELNQLKAAVTMPSIDERAAYAHYHEHRPHIASFCGTGNNVQFLSDPTGNRRWLPFEVDCIESPRDHPFDYTGIYSQAYALYKQGFRYWFSREEIMELSRHNEAFAAPVQEFELVDIYFRKPLREGEGEYMPVSRALQIIGGNVACKLSPVMLGRAFTQLGFESKMRHGVKGYIVVQRDVAQIKEYVRRMASDADDDSEPF